MNTPGEEGREVLKFAGKTLLLAMTLLVPWICLYVWLDPVRVVRREAAFFPNPSGEPFREYEGRNIMPAYSANDIMVRNLNAMRKRGIDYSGFIFGASISQNISIEDWRDAARIGDGEGLMHFGNNGETLMSMANKFEYLDRAGIRIRHALIVLNAHSMEQELNSISELRTPALFPGWKDKLIHGSVFHLTGFRTVMSASYLSTYLASLLKDSVIKVNGKSAMSASVLAFDRKRGEEVSVTFERLRAKGNDALRKLLPLMNPDTIPSRYPEFNLLAEDGIILQFPGYFANSRKVLYGEGLGDYLLAGFPSTIGASQSKIEHTRQRRLDAIRRIMGVMRRHQTDYKVLITPSRDKYTPLRADLEMLAKCFGNAHIADLSGKYHLLRNEELMYDEFHFNPDAGRIFLNLAYAPVFEVKIDKGLEVEPGQAGKW